MGTEILSALSAEGVAVWLDDLSRTRLATGDLERRVRDESLVGITTNPTIFQKAISGSEIYDEQSRDLALRGVDVGEALRAITTYDVRWACDVLAPVFEATEGRDGRVSIEVDPRIAHNAERSIAEGRALWWLVDRPNLFIKVPATLEGLPAISALIAEGISVNVTLIFSIDRYRKVMDAYLSGLEQAKQNGVDLSTIRSVASFFVSRVDTEIDKRLDKLGTDEARAVRGKAGIANARLAYQSFEETFTGDRWESLTAAGAHPQRPLWASTGVKDPAYDDTMYVTDLVAPNTVNTMPEATLHAVADHGQITGATANTGYHEARAVFQQLSELGIEVDEVTELLEVEGVSKFMDSWSVLLEGVQKQLTAGAKKAGK